MPSERMFEVMLLPRMEVAERFCTLREAEAWMRGYNESSGDSPVEAVIARQRSCRRNPPRSRAA